MRLPVRGVFRTRVDALDGRLVLAPMDAVREFFRLMVDGSMAVVTAMVQFRRTRWSYFIDQCMYIGSQALPIVGLVSLLAPALCGGSRRSSSR